MVINCDLPWNPARLEQRIARAWRKHQTRPVTVIHLVSENTIEQRMLGTLASKQALADGVLDLRGDLKEIKLIGGRQPFLNRLQQLMATTPPSTQPSRFAPRGRPGGGAPGDHASRNLRRRCSMLGDARNPENTGCRPHPADPVGRVGGGGARGVPVRPGPGGASMVIRT